MGCGQRLGRDLFRCKREAHHQPLQVQLTCRLTFSPRLEQRGGVTLARSGVTPTNGGLTPTRGGVTPRTRGSGPHTRRSDPRTRAATAVTHAHARMLGWP
eukprot:195481-Chlamydomonas_euryale.AAC.1